MLKNLLIHRCDLYTLKTIQIGGGHGRPTTTQLTREYNATPTLTNVPFYYGDVTTSQINQNSPGNVVTEKIKMFFTKDVPVTVEMKLVYEGIEYKLGVPRLVRNHHIEVEGFRTVLL